TEPVQSDDGREVAASIVCVFPGVFESWRTRRLTGRDLEWTDGPSALVTENLARRLYPNGDALARRIRTKTPPVRDLAIVGIVGNIALDRKSTRLNSSHVKISYAVFCLKKKNIYSKVISKTTT